MFLYKSGLRVSEIIALRGSDVNLVTHSVAVRHGKGDKGTVRGFHPGAADALARWTDTRKALGIRNGPLFCTLKGGPVSDQYVCNMLHHLARKADLDKRVHPHGLRHSYAVSLEMGRIAFDASFRRSREHALPAAQRAALRCPGLPGAPRGHDDLGLHGPAGADATMMRLIPLRRAHHSRACWHRDASGSSRLNRAHHRRSRWAVPGRRRSCEGPARPPHHWPGHAPDLATSRSRCTSCIPASRRRTFPAAASSPVSHAAPRRAAMPRTSPTRVQPVAGGGS